MGFKPFMTISFCGLTLLEGIIIMSRCTSFTAGIAGEQALFSKFDTKGKIYLND